MTDFYRINKIVQTLKVLGLTKSDRSFSRDFLGASNSSVFGAYKTLNRMIGVKHLGSLLFNLKNIERTHCFNGIHLTPYQTKQVGVLKGQVSDILREEFSEQSHISEILVLD